MLEKCFENVDEKMIDHIRRANMGHPDEIALRYLGTKVTYGGLFASIERCARALKANGVNAGDVVAVCLPNSPESVFFFYACNEIGAVAYLFDPRSTAGKLAECVKEAGVRLFVCELSVYAEKIAPSEKHFPLEHIVVVNVLASTGVRGRLYGFRYRSCLKNGKGISHEAFLASGISFKGQVASPYKADVPAIMVNTSGTSSDEVKGALHVNRSYNILANQFNIVAGTYGGPTVVRGEVSYGYIPFFVMYGSSVCMHWSLTNGVIIEIVPKFDWKKTVREVCRKKCNYLVSVPSLMDKLVSYVEEHHVDMSFMRHFIIGGDNIAPEKLEHMNSVMKAHGAGSAFTFGYGATEAMIISSTNDDPHSRKSGSCGVPIPGVTVRIIDPETQAVLPAYSEGEVIVSSPCLFQGYLNRPDENRRVFLELDGSRWFRTGDAGYLDEDGLLFVCGRYKRLMKRPDGHQVSSIPIENAISSCPGIADVAVVGIKKDASDGGVIPAAFVVLKEDALAAAAEKAGTDATISVGDFIRNMAASSLLVMSGEREIALAYTIVSSIPLTMNGKQDYRALESHHFGDGSDWYVVEDLMTDSYLKGVPGVRFIHL